MTRRSLLGLLLIGILLTSCGGTPAADEPTPDINATVAAAAQTLAASLFQTQTAIAPTATNTPLPTVTSLPTTTALTLPSALPSATQGVIFFSSPTPTGTFYTSTPSSSSLAVGCNNMALVRDVTIPSGTVFRPGETFTKTWQVANTGTCNWLYGYSLVHASGDNLGGNGYRLSSRINVPVPPGEWRQISVELDAPNNPGTYTGTWRIANGEGQMFGASLGVSIVVTRNPDPTGTPNTLETAVAGTVAVQMTQTAAAQQTAVSIGQTAVAATATCAVTPKPAGC